MDSLAGFWRKKSANLPSWKDLTDGNCRKKYSVEERHRNFLVNMSVHYEDVLKVLQEESVVRRKRQRALMWIVGGMVALQAAAFGWMVSTGAESISNAIIMVAPFICLIGAGVGLSPRGKSALLDAASSDDERITNFLIESLDCGEIEVVEQSKDSLRRLLPLVTDQSPPLDRVQHAALMSRLAVDDELFVSLLVRSLGKIGRMESIAILEDLVHDRKSAYTQKKSVHIRGAAVAALPELRIRLASEFIQKKIEEVDRMRDELTRRMESSVELSGREIDGISENS